MNSENRIVITTDYLKPGDDVDQLLKSHGYCPHYMPHSGPRSEAERSDLLAGAVGAIIASEPITENMISTAGNLKVIARSGVGYDSVDLQAATKHQVAVCSTPGVNHHAVAELALGLMLSMARQIHRVIPEVAAGNWPRTAGTELRGKTLGIIGYGPSGQAMATLGLALGMQVVVHTSHPQPPVSAVSYQDLQATAQAADYLSLHSRPTGAGPLVDALLLSQMKPSAVLINTARGSLVDESALLEAVNNGVIAGAALDVVNEEPLPASHPLRGQERILVFSHLAGQTLEARQRAGMMAAESVIAVLEGRKPVHQVN